MKILVVYVFHEYNQRVKYFIENAIFKDEIIDFIIVCNDKDFKINNIPTYVKYINRENNGYDFGAWSYALLTDNLYKIYTHILCANSSIIGPFNYKDKWVYKYIEGLKDNIKLFGSTINIYNNNNFIINENEIDVNNNTLNKLKLNNDHDTIEIYTNDFKNLFNRSHLQTYIFALDVNTFEFLIKCKIFTLNNENYKDIQDVIHNKEVQMSRKIIENGWNIGCFHSMFKDFDFTFKNNIAKNTLLYYEDMTYDIFNNFLWKKEDLIFIKGNRVNY